MICVGGDGCISTCMWACTHVRIYGGQKGVWGPSELGLKVLARCLTCSVGSGV